MYQVLFFILILLQINIMNFKRIVLFFIISIFYSFKNYSTHIRAGEIIAKRISNTSLTYEFTIIGYTDTGSDVQFGGGKFDFGDGCVLINDTVSPPEVSNNNENVIFIYDNFIFQDDTNNNVLTKICHYCSKEEINNNEIYCWYEV